MGPTTLMSANNGQMQGMRRITAGCRVYTHSMDCAPPLQMCILSLRAHGYISLSVRRNRDGHLIPLKTTPRPARMRIGFNATSISGRALFLDGTIGMGPGAAGEKLKSLAVGRGDVKSLDAFVIRPEPTPASIAPRWWGPMLHNTAKTSSNVLALITPYFASPRSHEIRIPSFAFSFPIHLNQSHPIHHVQPRRQDQGQGGGQEGPVGRLQAAHRAQAEGEQPAGG